MLKRDGDILRERWSYFDEAASANNFLLSSFANTVLLYFALFANNALINMTKNRIFFGNRLELVFTSI